MLDQQSALPECVADNRSWFLLDQCCTSFERRHICISGYCCEFIV